LQKHSNEFALIEESKDYYKMELILGKTAKRGEGLLKERLIIRKEINATGSSLDDNKEFIELYEKLKESYKRLEDNINLGEITVTKDNFKQVESIIRERIDLIELIESTHLKVVTILSRFTVKKCASNIIVWLNYKKSAITFINLNTELYYLKLTAPPEVQPAKRLRLTGCPSLVKVNDIVYFIGGFTGKKSLNNLFSMLIKNPGERLIKLQSMKVSRHDISAVQIVNKYLYAISGSIFVEDNEIRTRKCEVYDIGKNKWRYMCPVNVGTAAAGISVFNDRYIFIYGGQVEGSCTNRFERYDVLDEESGWLLHKVSESILEDHISDMQMPMFQISTKEIILVHSDRIRIIEIKQEAIVRTKEIGTRIYELYYPSTEVYKGKVYWTENNHLCYYDTIKKVCKFIPSAPSIPS